MMENRYFPFKDKQDYDDYIKKTGLAKYACSKHGLDYEFSCTECHDKWKEFIDGEKITVISSYGSTSIEKQKERIL